MTKVSVIIRCYNEEKHIGRLLTGITQQVFAPVEIILVDSGSTDDTLAIAGEYPVKVLHIQPEEFSFGRSLNIGCRSATGDLLVIVSAHVYPVYTDWLEKLIRPFSNPDVALVYGKQRGNRNTKFAEHQVFRSWFPNQSVAKQNHPFCNNANAAIRASLWDQRQYDETLTGLEDIDWAKWALGAGYDIAYREDAGVIHVHDEKPLETYNRYRREAIAFKRIFDDEKFSFKDFVVLGTTNILSDFRMALHEGIFFERWFESMSFRLMQFWGTYRGFKQSGKVSSRLKRKFYYSNNLGQVAETAFPRRSGRKRINYDTQEYNINEDN